MNEGLKKLVVSQHLKRSSLGSEVQDLSGAC